MNPWEIVAEQEKVDSEARYRLVLLRSSTPWEPYRVYGLERRNGFWDLVDKFNIPGSDGADDTDWAFEQAWMLFDGRGLASGRQMSHLFHKSTT